MRAAAGRTVHCKISERFLAKLSHPESIGGFP
ncbi:hypothetical protein CHELA1G2_12195 [Hyphomicrobiales bacterium]|nr:hypothetical protein CHELA1G2_12195 [Hyphomicrobiales bacterium]